MTSPRKIVQFALEIEASRVWALDDSGFLWYSPRPAEWKMYTPLPDREEPKPPKAAEPAKVTP